MPQRLPNELVDKIISSIAPLPWLPREERQTLLNCTLVCRDWLPASRHALFSDVRLRGSAAWDSFRLWVVDAEEGRPWLLSIHHFTFEDRCRDRRTDGKTVLAEPISGWRGQYVIPVLAGHLPNLESLSLTVDWARCEPHPTTFGLFAQFTSLRRVEFWECQLPSFGTFRRTLVSFPALKHLICNDVHWPSAPQPSILAIRSEHPTLETLRIDISCRSCTLALLEWLICTPTRSTLVGLDLHPGSPGTAPHQHRVSLPHPNFDYYAQIFAPSLRWARFDQTQKTDDATTSISLSAFRNLSMLHLRVDGTDWSDVASMLRLLPSRLDTLFIDVFYRWPVTDNDLLVKEDSELKPMKTNELALLDPVLSCDNFKDLRHLSFQLVGYHDTLPAYRESTLETIRRKLPTSYSRESLKIDLYLVCFDRFLPDSPVAEDRESVQPTA